ncbi:MAG: tRNA lysidine(34) synthetase TilS [Oscillibacter sp.]|nr:tRNA lysidine(34) synthetase TilS [Oscillibacter sp.]
MTTSESARAAEAFALAARSCGKERAFLCAVSGGRDSMCLLRLASDWCKKNGGRVAAAHFNHQLRKNADADERFVRAYCEERNIPFFAGRGDCRARAEQYGETVEEAARNLRYAFLERTREDSGYDWILTAHHADDNAETVLFNLVRGAGMRGLCGIPRRRGRVFRPLLDVPREAIDAYVSENGVPFAEDETNADDAIARNLLRHKVLPVLKELNPRAAEHIFQTSRRLRADDAALAAYAEALTREAVIEEGRSARILRRTLADAESAVALRAIRALLFAVCGKERDLTAEHSQSVYGVALAGGQVSLPYGMLARREDETLVIEKTAAPPSEVPVQIGETVRFGGWTVTLAPSGEGEEISLPENAALTVSAWRRGDRLNGRTLKRLCVDRGVAPHERETLPVLRCGGVAVAAALLGEDKAFAPNENEARLTVRFQKETKESPL